MNHSTKVKRSVLVLAAMCLAGPAMAQDAIDEELTALRQELAATKLALQQSQAELEQIKAFLEDRGVDTTLAEWKKRREALAEERRLIRLERQKLEQARRELHQQTLKIAQDQVQEKDAEAEALAKALEPNWSAQYMLGLIDEQRQTIYVKSTTGHLLIKQYPTVDQRNVMVRGTFLNKSLAPWRYTFEIALASQEGPGLPTRQPDVAGSWRYQTPLLGPGQLHTFEVKVPVEHVRYIDVIQIGNVVADRPPQPEGEMKDQGKPAE